MGSTAVLGTTPVDVILWIAAYRADMQRHQEIENSISEQDMQTAVGNTRRHFEQVFGTALAQKAFTPPSGWIPTLEAGPKYGGKSLGDVTVYADGRVMWTGDKLLDPGIKPRH